MFVLVVRRVRLTESGEQRPRSLTGPRGAGMNLFAHI